MDYGTDFDFEQPERTKEDALERSSEEDSEEYAHVPENLRGPSMTQMTDDTNQR